MLAAFHAYMFQLKPGHGHPCRVQRNCEDACICWVFLYICSILGCLGSAHGFAAPAWTNLGEGLRVLVNPYQTLDDLGRLENLAAFRHAMMKDLGFLLAESLEQSQEAECLYRKEHKHQLLDTCKKQSPLRPRQRTISHGKSLTSFIFEQTVRIFSR